VSAPGERAARSRRRAIVLAALSLALVVIPAAGSRADAPTDVALPWTPEPRALERGPLPDDFREAARGAILWVYPVGESERVPALEAVVAEAWPRLTSELGGAIAPRMTIVIARDLAELARLAPRDHPPPRYAVGVAYPAAGLILLSLDAPGLSARPDLEVVLVHELAHLALFRAVGGHAVPRWFAEGLAIHQAGEQTLARIQTLYAALGDGSLLPLDELDGAFAAHPFEVDVAYAESADLVGFLQRDTQSPRKLRRLVAELRRGAPFDAALLASFHYSLPTLEREWRDDLRERFGSLPLVLGGGALWVFASVLLVLAFRKRRVQQRRALTRMGDEEAALARLERLVQAKLDEGPRGDVPAPPPEEGLPTIVHEGRNHTIH
jgi:hypothetical protein